MRLGLVENQVRSLGLTLAPATFLFITWTTRGPEGERKNKRVFYREDLLRAKTKQKPNDPVA